MTKVEVLIDLEDSGGSSRHAQGRLRDNQSVFALLLAGRRCTSCAGSRHRHQLGGDRSALATTRRGRRAREGTAGGCRAHTAADVQGREGARRSERRKRAGAAWPARCIGHCLLPGQQASKVNPRAVPLVPMLVARLPKLSTLEAGGQQPGFRNRSRPLGRGVTELALRLRLPGRFGELSRCWGFSLPLPPTARCALDANRPPGPSLVSKVQFVPSSGYRRARLEHCRDGLSQPRLLDVASTCHPQFPFLSPERHRRLARVLQAVELRFR